MELTQLKYFVLVAEHGSTARAAAAAMVSQSTVSKSILHLEQELELPLFDRTGNRLQLNPAGQELLQQVRPLLNSVAKLPEAVRNRHRTRRTYRINVSAANPCMGALTHYLLSAEPEAQIQLRRGSWINDCDLSIAAGASGRPEDSRLLLRERVLLAVPKGFVKEEKTRLDLIDMEQIPLVLPGEDTALGAEVRYHMESIPAVLQVSAVVPEFETLRQLVESGSAAAFWPEYSWPRPDPETVALIPVQGLEFHREIYAILPPQNRAEDIRPLMDRVAAFFYSLVEEKKA